MPIGFIGLGVMGEPMARNLVASGIDVVVWNRSEPALSRLVAVGASGSSSVDDLFDRCDVVIVMLATEAALDATLERGVDSFERRMHGRTLVNMGTNSPDYSRAFEAAVRAAG